MKRLLVIIVLALVADSCIREDVLLPPEIVSTTDPLIVNESGVINGKNFDPTSTQLFINDTLRRIDYVETNEIKFQVPDIRTATAAIYVQTKYGRSETVNVKVIAAKPIISEIIPKSAGGGKRIKIVGAHIEKVNHAFFFKTTPEIEAKIVGTKKDTIEVEVPDGLPVGGVSVTVAIDDLHSTVVPFTILPKPLISVVTPTKSAKSGIVKITGINFDRLLSVKFGDVEAEIIMASDQLIQVLVPLDASSNHIYVDTWGGTDESSATFEIIPGPEIKSLDKWQGGAGTEVTISGLYFEDVFEVRFGKTAALIIDKTATTIKTKVPVGAESDLIYVTSSSSGKGKSANIFTVVKSARIDSFLPISGGPGTIVTISGAGLLDVNAMLLGLKELNIQASSRTDEKLEVEIPSGSITGLFIAKGGFGEVSSATQFEVPNTPRIDVVSPGSGSVNAIITITGANFPTDAVVEFAQGIKVTPLTIESGKITCKVPVNAIKGKISIAGALSPIEFVVLSKPIIISIIPMQGGIDKEVTIKGAYLSGVTVKFFNEKNATVSSGGSDTEIKVKVPAGAATGKITIVGSGDAGFVTSDGDFQILAPPTVAGITPLTGISGNLVTITGTNLQFNPTVTFAGGIPATVKSVAPTQLVVEVPLGAQTGPIQIRTDAVASPVSTVQFTVIGKPKIESLSMTSGTIYERIIVRGQNFGNLVSVTFDGKPATDVIASTQTEITVRVPVIDALATRPINVQVRTTTDVSTDFGFLLLATPIITKVTPSNNPRGWAFLIEGSNLSSIRKISLAGKIPDVGTAGIERKTDNYIVTKVPSTSTPGDTQPLLLYHTTEDYMPIPRTYKILNQAPPGYFPPTTIVILPALPSNYFQTDLSDYWLDVNWKQPGLDSAFSCYQLRANFTGKPQSGTFCQIIKTIVVKDPSSFNGDWRPDNNGIVEDADDKNGGQGSPYLLNGLGKWSNGNLNLKFFKYNSPDTIKYTGRVLDQQASRLVLEDVDGRQVILKQDKPNGVGYKAIQTSGPCN